MTITSNLYLGACPRKPSETQVSGRFVEIGNETFYRISNYDAMDPFFMSIVSDSDHWMFVSSTGGLSAGRQNSDNALFPYYTVDKIHDSSEITGSKTIIRVHRDDRALLWEPFSRYGEGQYSIRRNIYKNIAGNKVMFEEINLDLSLGFRYTWCSSEKYGFIKQSALENTGTIETSAEVVDGIQNLMPWGLAEFLQSMFSCLTDAYKKNELDGETGLGIFSLSSIPGDKAEPAEALRTTVAWSSGLDQPTRLLSSLQLDKFRKGGALKEEKDVKGRRGAFFVSSVLKLAPQAQKQWLIAADVDLGPSDAAALRKNLLETPDMASLVMEDVEAGSRNLTQIVAMADGLQVSRDRLTSVHHFANVMFNAMRGGIFPFQYLFPSGDFKHHVKQFNKEVAVRQAGFLDAMGADVSMQKLLTDVKATKDADFIRLAYEYLPLSFSRRHGDPSRPWNKFSIQIKNRDGSKILNYQGNWRDIFQNWEALCLSYPEYIESIIAKFVNTTTADGYNPYKVTKDGFDWEAPSPDEPWANIGYWGDHQIIYLLKLLEWSKAFHGKKLEAFLQEEIFTYANVPYDIKPYADLLKDPRASIEYNRSREKAISAAVDSLGLDGKYLKDQSGGLCRVNLTEKLLVTLLAKVSNFIPGAGFWMNTQRPEWNDANNALAGYGVSMVTLYYARRYSAFCLELLSGAGAERVRLSEEVLAWFRGTADAVHQNLGLLTGPSISDGDRKAVLDGLGTAAGKYRAGIYHDAFSGEKGEVNVSEITAFLGDLLQSFDNTIRMNRRDDGLYHAYNVMTPSDSRVSVGTLYEMLEGQVSALSSGSFSPEEAVSVLESLRSSSLYRGDQHSYILYPNRRLPDFFEKNNIPDTLVEKSELLKKLLTAGDRSLVEKDIQGICHFNGAFHSVRDAEKALEVLREKGYGDLVEKETALIREIFETVFNHKEFTGRSGTFYGYEGLGCIYWHMVSKLLLAAQEACFAAAENDCDPEVLNKLKRLYYDVRAGIGFNKSPDVYGAFPTDPYSHTPGYAGAKQPGMTGQVKEEVITRLGELGLRVRDGQIRFQPVLLRKEEFLAEDVAFEYYGVSGKKCSLSIPAGSLAFTYCQVPVVCRLSDTWKIVLHGKDGTAVTIQDRVIDQQTSAKIFCRTGEVERMEVFMVVDNGL